MSNRYVHKMETAAERKERIAKAAKERTKKARKEKEAELNSPDNLHENGKEIFEAILGAAVDEGKLFAKQHPKKVKKKK